MAVQWPALKNSNKFKVNLSTPPLWYLLRHAMHSTHRKNFNFTSRMHLAQYFTFCRFKHTVWTQFFSYCSLRLVTFVFFRIFWWFLMYYWSDSLWKCTILGSTFPYPHPNSSAKICTSKMMEIKWNKILGVFGRFCKFVWNGDKRDILTLQIHGWRIVAPIFRHIFPIKLSDTDVV